jgi:ClpP class serine protease
VRTSSVLAFAVMFQNIWLLSHDALQTRIVRAIREARSPIVARSERPASARASRLTPAGKDGVATIRVEGLLTPTPDAQSEFYGEPNTTYTELREAMTLALADKKTKEVVWSIDSPGGAVDGLFALLDEIADANASGANMRVEADNAHSAAYGIAAAVGNITANSRMSSFGSIGVAVSSFVQGGLCGEVVDLTNSDSPEKRPNVKTPEGREVVTRYLDQLATEFFSSIAAGRGVTRDHVALKYGRGSSMLAGPAKEAGLIDAVAVKGNVRTHLTCAHTPDTVPDCMAEPSPAPEASSAPEAAPVAVALPLDIPVTVDLSGLDAADRAELATLRAERDARASADRRALVTDLVALGAETPATAWKDGAPVARLASEHLDDLRGRVAALRAVKSPAAAAGVTPPASGASLGEDDLQDFERADAAKIKDPTARARFIAGRLAKKQKA